MTQTATARLFEALRSQIERGEFEEGTRLMSLRRASRQFSVSKNIVVTVYDRLVAHGLVTSRPGSGFYVRANLPPTSEPPNLRAASDIVSLLHTQLERSYDVLVGDGRPPASWMTPISSGATCPVDEVGYGTPYGLMELRNCIATAHLSAGIDVSPSQVVTTFGANHALDLIIRRFVRHGDTVLVDDPGYYPLFAKLKLAGVKVVGIPRTNRGPDTHLLEQEAKAHRASVFFTQSLAQNPTGTSMDLQTAHAVLQIAERQDLLIVDDDPFIDLPGVTGTRLAQLDAFRRVIQIGTYSKTLSPIYRSGFIIAAPDIASSLAELKMILIVNSSSHSERLIADTILTRRYEKFCNSLAKRLTKERDAVSKKLGRLGFEFFSSPVNGLYGLMYLPSGLNDLELAAKAADQGIFLAPGSLFNANDQQRPPCMRINWSRANDARFFRFLKGVC